MSDRSRGIVLPAYRPDWKQLRLYTQRIQQEVQPDRILVELDGETYDGQLPESVEVFSSPERRGKGAAIAHGFDSLETDVLVFADSDGSVPPSSINEVLDSLDTGLVVGSRRHADAEIRSNQTLLRKALGDAFSRVASKILPLEIQDYQCGVKALDSELWEDVGLQIESKGFSWDLELITTASREGYRVEEVPVVWEDRPGSTVPVLKTSVDLLRQLLSARRRL